MTADLNNTEWLREARWGILPRSIGREYKRSSDVESRRHMDRVFAQVNVARCRKNILDKYCGITMGESSDLF